MVFQSLSVLVSKTAREGAGSKNEEYVGEVLSSIAQVYLFNAITKFTGTWFDNRFRPIATAVIILFGHLGQNTVQWITYTWMNNAKNVNPFSNDQPKDIYEIIDEFKLTIFILNIILTVVIFFFFESKPRDYPTLSQKYHRSKMYEPHLDIKYLLQYKEFKLYAIVIGLLLTAVNVMPSVTYAFLFVEA